MFCIPLEQFGVWLISLGMSFKKNTVWYDWHSYVHSVIHNSHREYVSLVHWPWSKLAKGNISNIDKQPLQKIRVTIKVNHKRSPMTTSHTLLPLHFNIKPAQPYTTVSLYNRFEWTNTTYMLCLTERYVSRETGAVLVRVVCLSMTDICGPCPHLSFCRCTITIQRI